MNFSSSEAVGIGHPDKIADRISDSIFDKALSLDKDVKFACEVLVSKNSVSIAGEIYSDKFFNTHGPETKIEEILEIKKISRKILEELGYQSSFFKFFINLNYQSKEIYNSVVKSDKEIGSGDQGIVFGYATNETPSFLPLAYVMAQELVSNAEKLIKNRTFY